MPTPRIYPVGATCKEPGCSNPIHAKWLCRSHYHQQITKLRPRNTRKCSICGRSPVVARGYCTGHYSRWVAGKVLDNTPIRELTSRPPECIETDCQQPVHAKLRCRTHYYHFMLLKAAC